MTDLMVVLDYVRPSYLNQKGQFVFTRTHAGKDLIKAISAPRVGLGLSLDDVDVTFAYGAVPPLDSQSKPKKITKKQGKPFFDKLKKHILDVRPKVILALGNTALMGLVGNVGIDKRRGIPVKIKIDDFETWVIPTYSMETTYMNANKKGLFLKDISLTKEFLEKGEAGLRKGVGKYELVTDFDRVKEIFTNILGLPPVSQPKYKIVAVDFETNTLHGEFQNVLDKNGTGKTVSAKPIILSMSWKEKQGVAIPLDHKAQNWPSDKLNQIYDWIRQLFMSDQWIVMHNGQFDVTFLKETIGLKYTNHVIDTLLMYYVGVSEDKDVPKGLKHLAYQYTDMGGYEAPLDEYKKKFLEDHYDTWLAKKEKEKAETGKTFRKRADYTPIVNEVDGDTFNYEWIPLNIIYPYASADTDACLRIYNKLKDIIKSNPKWVNLVYFFYPKLQETLTDIQKNGLCLDVDYTKKIHKKYIEERKAILETMYKKIPEISYLEEERQSLITDADMEKKKPKEDQDVDIINKAKKYRGNRKDGVPKYKFNFASPRDKKYLLYYMLGFQLPFDKDYLTDSAISNGVTEDSVTWNDYKADAKSAMPYLESHYDSPAIKLLSSYSKIDKAIGSFIEKLPPLLDNNGLIHTTFNMAVTATSRLSSSGNFNMQQLPRRDANPSHFNYKYPVKGMIKSRFKGGIILNIDFKTLEIYVAAMLSQDNGMEQILINNEDYHSETARKIFNLPKDKPVLKNVRSQAKSASFGKIDAA